jgi:hypothetical protein
MPKIKYLFPSIKYPIFHQNFGDFLPKIYLYLEGTKQSNGGNKNEPNEPSKPNE